MILLLLKGMKLSNWYLSASLNSFRFEYGQVVSLIIASSLGKERIVSPTKFFFCISACFNCRVSLSIKSSILSVSCEYLTSFLLTTVITRSFPLIDRPVELWENKLMNGILFIISGNILLFRVRGNNSTVI